MEFSINVSLYLFILEWSTSYFIFILPDITKCKYYYFLGKHHFKKSIIFTILDALQLASLFTIFYFVPSQSLFSAGKVRPTGIYKVAILMSM